MHNLLSEIVLSEEDIKEANHAMAEAEDFQLHS